MTQRLATAPVTVRPSFTIQASKTHVTVKATDRALGLRELLATMKTEPRLHNCVIEQCAFDGDCFTATLRIER
ncbi:MAG: hypothetical protein ACYC2H_07470 [Thermoplasmatota archaeon]